MKIPRDDRLLFYSTAVVLLLEVASFTAMIIGLGTDNFFFANLVVSSYILGFTAILLPFALVMSMLVRKSGRPGATLARLGGVTLLAELLWLVGIYVVNRS